MGENTVEASRFYIGGDWVEPSGRESVAIHNPATLAPVGTAVLGNEIDADKAVSAAKAAFASWQFSAIEDRIALLHRMRKAYEAIAPAMERHLVNEIGITAMVAQGQTRMTLSHFDGVLEFLADYPF